VTECACRRMLQIHCLRPTRGLHPGVSTNRIVYTSGPNGFEYCRGFRELGIFEGEYQFEFGHLLVNKCDYFAILGRNCNNRHFDCPVSSPRTPLLCTMHYALCTMDYALCTMHYALCTMHYALCTMHYALWTMHCALCTMDYAVQCTMHYAVQCTRHYALCCTRGRGKFDMFTSSLFLGAHLPQPFLLLL
jgi:hypothetical protein